MFSRWLRGEPPSRRLISAVEEGTIRMTCNFAYREKYYAIVVTTGAERHKSSTDDKSSVSTFLVLASV